MAGLFYQIYLFLRRNRLIAFLGIALILGGALFSISKLKFSENIRDVIPGNKRLDEISKTIEGLEVNNQITLHFYRDTALKADPDQLIAAADYVTKRLEKNSTSLVRDVRSTVESSRIDSAYAQIYKFLPYYLTREDYQKIGRSASKEGIRKAIRGAYKSLNSPVGSFSSKYILKDPLGLTYLPLERFRALSSSGDIEVYKDHLFSKDNAHLLAFLILEHPSSETLRNAALIDSLDACSADVQRRFPDVEMSYFGSAAVAVANARQIREDIYLTVGLASLFLIFLIFAYFRRAETILIVLIPGVLGALIAGAVLAFLGRTVSTVALAAGSALLGITIDYALHFLAHRRKTDSVKTLYADLTDPILICGVTTASAFFSLMLLGSPALSDLGLFAGISVLVAAISTLLFLPQVTGRKYVAANTANTGKVEAWIKKLADKPWHKSKIAWGLLLIITVTSAFTWKSYSFETDMLNLNFMPPHLAKAQTELNKVADYSKNTVYMAAHDSTLDAALEKNRGLDSLLDSFMSEGLISSYLSINALVPSPGERHERLRRWNTFWDERGRESAINDLDSIAAKYRFQPGVFAQADSLIYTKTLNPDTDDLLAISDLMGRGILINASDSSGVSVLSFAKVADKDKPLLINRLQGREDILILDRTYITSQLITKLKADFSELINISLLIVFLILLLSYGRIELAIMAFIPTALSWFWILGIMGLFHLSFNIVNVIIGTFIFGLGIDYSVVQLRGLLQGYASAKADTTSYRQSILLSAITTIVGIGVLIFAKHPALKSIAMLAIIGMSSVVFITFVVQPLLFNFFIGNRKKKDRVPFTLLTFLQTVFAFSYFLLGCLLLNVLVLILRVPIGLKQSKKIFFHWVLMLFCRSLIYIMVNTEKRILHRERMDFSRPAICIANHHSFIDILLALMFHPKMVMVTNDWVYNSPFFGAAVRYAGFVHAAGDLENQLKQIEQLVADGFSIFIFPEGTRSGSNTLGRFHKGSFYLSEKLQLDIQPILIHGTAEVMPKGDDFYLKSNVMTVDFLPRIAWDDSGYGNGYRERTKTISAYFKSRHRELRTEVENPDFFRNTIVKNFIYKGPVLEWYLRVKIRMEDNYKLFHQLIPGSGKIVDLGCGYGFMTYALAFAATGREMLGIDYDASKIEIARNCPVVPSNLSFQEGDVMDFSRQTADAFVISDVIHYLTKEEQLRLLHNMREALIPGGVIVIRDGDTSLKRRHRGSVLTEIFSTGTGFNKTRNPLNFISTGFIRQFAKDTGLQLEIIDNTKHTSNLIFILKS